MSASVTWDILPHSYSRTFFFSSNDIPPILAVLGMFNESFYAPLNPTHPNPARKFRSSFIVPFRGTVAMERMSCVIPARLATPTEVHHVPGASPSPLPSSQFVRVKVCHFLFCLLIHQTDHSER